MTLYNYTAIYVLDCAALRLIQHKSSGVKSISYSTNVYDMHN